MPRNIEIKARLASAEHRASTELLVAQLEGVTGPTEIKQHDTFFECANGRLKLRVFDNGSGNLIQYQRADETGPKCSTYRIYETKDAAQLGKVLSDSLKTTVCVVKTRQLYLVGQTRIHLDEVRGLGHFVELEVVLRDDQTEEEGRRVADALVSSLKLTDLVPDAYADLLLQ